MCVYIYIYIYIYRHVFRCSTAHQCSLVQSGYGTATIYTQAIVSDNCLGIYIYTVYILRFLSDGTKTRYPNILNAIKVVPCCVGIVLEIQI